MIKKILLAAVAPVVGLGLLVSCEPPPDARADSISLQAWVQRDANGDGRADFPQTLPAGGGGHIHAEFHDQFPLSDDPTLDVTLKSHQGFQGTGDRLDLGLAPGGDSLGDADAPSIGCGPKPQMCSFPPVSVHASGVPNTASSLRLRYLPANLPNGERWFLSSELPTNGFSTEWGGLCAKSWLGEYATACFRDLHLVNGKTVSGTIQIPAWTKGDHSEWGSVHVDANFGEDNEGRVLIRQAGLLRENVPFDTRTVSNGWHRISIRNDASGIGAGRVHTGVIEIYVNVQN